MCVCRRGKTIYPKDDLGGAGMTGEGGRNVNFAFAAEGMDDTDYLPAYSAALLMIKVSLRNMIGDSIKS